jgi:Flp pilus assembly protein TadG
MKRLLSTLCAFRSEQRGAAAVEFALWLTVSLYPLLNVVDFGLYAYDRTQVENSAQMAVQVASTACGQQSAVPVLQYCTNLSSMMDARAASTSLGSTVTVVNHYECNTNVLTWPSPAPASPPACPSATGDYVGVAVSYTYVPLFKAVTVTSIFGTTITRIYWTRVA